MVTFLFLGDQLKNSTGLFHSPRHGRFRISRRPADTVYPQTSSLANFQARVKTVPQTVLIHKLKFELADANCVAVFGSTGTEGFIDTHATQLASKFHDRFVTVKVGHGEEFFELVTR